MQPLDRNPRVEAQYRTLIILWFAILNSIVLFFVLTLFVTRPEAQAEDNDVLVWALAGVGTLLAVISTVPKKKFLERASEQQQPQLVQTAYVIAFALSEVASLFGLLIYFMTGERYYFLMFLVSAIFMLVHFPRREHLAAATYKSPRV